MNRNYQQASERYRYNAAMKAKDVQAFFEQVASNWDTMRLAYYDERVIEKMAQVASVGQDSEVADVGTGTGFVAAGLAPRVLSESSELTTLPLCSGWRVRIPMSRVLTRLAADTWSRAKTHLSKSRLDNLCAL